MGRRVTLDIKKVQHKLTKVKVLMDIILGYLQYEEALEVYSEYNLTKPIMPTMTYDNYKDGTIEFDVNIETLYFPSDYHFDMLKFTAMNNMDLYYRTVCKWQCPKCMNYNTYNHQIKYCSLVNKTNGTIIDLYYLCNCSLSLYKTVYNTATSVGHIREDAENLNKCFNSVNLCYATQKPMTRDLREPKGWENRSRWTREQWHKAGYSRS